MLPANHIAFKEWAAVCAALGDGTQILIVRKGGIHEGREGFRVAHGEFWLFPTYVHEAAEGLEADAAALLERAERERPPAGLLRLSQYAVVTDVYEIHEASILPRLAGRHIWSARTLDERFHYRRPGLFVLLVRMYKLARAHEIPDSPHFAGCRSWVELPLSLSTAGAIAALGDEEFEHRRTQLREILDAELRGAAT